MNKLICRHCKTELTLNNIKDIEFGRIYEMTELGEIDKEVAYIRCSKCGNITETDNETGHSLRVNLINMWRIFNYDILYDFEDIGDLLDNLSDSDKEKIKDCEFKLFEECPDDDSGDVYYDLKVYKDGIEVGKINMYYHSNTYFDLIDRDVKTTNASPYYTYEIKLYEDLSNKAGFGIKAKWNPFDDSKFRCKKCGKVFCACNKSFSKGGK